MQKNHDDEKSRPFVLATHRGLLKAAFVNAWKLATRLELVEHALKRKLGGRQVVVFHEQGIDRLSLEKIARQLKDRGAGQVSFESAPIVEITDEEAARLIEAARHAVVPLKWATHGSSEEQIKVEGDGLVPARVDLPRPASGIVIFAHGRGSDRTSPRNQKLAQTLRFDGVGTILVDLSVDEESRDAQVAAATKWAKEKFPELPIALFGSGSGSIAVLRTAAELRDTVQSVVCRSAPVRDAQHWLAQVQAPVLLIVGDEDNELIEASRAALENMSTRRELELVPGAGRNFSEPGALEAVGHLAVDWYVSCFRHASSLAIKKIGA